MSLRDGLWALLAWGMLPAWLLAGAADWLCHRRARIAVTSGPRESALHAVLFLQVALPTIAALHLEVTAALITVMAAGVLAHMLTSWWDTSLAQPRRYISPIEQQVHSWLEMLPLFALLVVALLHFGELAAPRWQFELRTDSPSIEVKAAVQAGLALGFAFIIEEAWRGLRAARLNARAVPAVGSRP